jgi:hypothetical protein
MINYKSDSDLKRMTVKDLKDEIMKLDTEKVNFDFDYENYVMKINTMIRYRQLWCGEK